MSYVSDMDELSKAMNDNLENTEESLKQTEYRRLEWELAAIYDLCKKVVENNIRHQAALEKNQYAADNNMEGEGYHTGSIASETLMHMTAINKICVKYGVTPMFPEAGSNTKDDVIIRGACKCVYQMMQFELMLDRIFEDQEDDQTGEDMDEAPEFQTATPFDIESRHEGLKAEDFMIDYNTIYKDSPYSLCREEIIKQTISCMLGKFKPNALLIGAAGVGKTKIVEDIASRIENEDPMIPEQLKGHKIWELPISNIISGSCLFGELERKLKCILDYAGDPENKAIIFIDEIHMLIEGGQEYDKIGQIMKPALSRGNIKVIGATTLQESHILMRDPAFNRRFTRLIVDELSQEQTKEVLKHTAKELIGHYGGKLLIDDRLLEEVINIADSYKSIGSHRPDNAITLLDRVLADAIMENQNPKSRRKIRVSKERMKRTAMRLMTGNNEKAVTDIEMLKRELSVIKGQDKVIDQLVDAIRRDELAVFPRERPLTFLFAGNSGVGKTEVAKILARTITGIDPIILNMTEYHSSASINRIIGSPDGYAGSDSNAELPFDILESNPYQVILLDEFEKSDRSVQRLFMSALDEGCIRTARGKVVDFSKAIIIATTNAGYTSSSKKIGFGTAEDSNDVDASIKDLSRDFDVELLNRFTRIMKFGNITEDIFREIIADTYKRDIKRARSVSDICKGFKKRLPKEDEDRMVKEGFNESFGARHARDIVQKYIEDQMLKTVA